VGVRSIRLVFGRGTIVVMSSVSCDWSRAEQSRAEDEERVQL
jgi:hypothetical protein